MHLKNFLILNHCYPINRDDFPGLVSYNRLVELMQKALLPLAVYRKTCCLGKCAGISYVDSFHIKACHIKRSNSNKVMKGLPTKGQCSIRWFFGLKLHFVINDKGKLLDFILTSGNVDDRHPLTRTNLLSRIFGKLSGDKGYILQSLFERLIIDGIHLITKLRKNMKKSPILLSDKILFRKRALIESVFDELKNIYQIENTRLRSREGFIIKLLSGLIFYSYLPKKPSLNLKIIDQSRALSFNFISNFSYL